MKHKQFEMSILFLLGIAFSAMQAQNMIVKAKSGTSSAYVINETRKLTFSGGNLVITKIDGSTASIAISETRYLNFSDLTGLRDAKQGTSKLVVYPNPVQDKLNLSLTDETSERVQVDVFSIVGKTVYSQTLNAQQAVNHTINVSMWQNGMYLIRINNGRETVTTKFTKD